MLKETLDYLVKYLNHELDEKTDAEFEAHLQDCPPCRAFLRDFKAILVSYQKLSQEKAKTMIAVYVMAKMPVELVHRLDHLEKVLVNENSRYYGH